MTVPETKPVCCVCGRPSDRTLDERGKFTVELRPYGPGGAPICFQCATATPEREAQVKRAFGALLGAAEAISPIGVAAIGQESGPVPFAIGPQSHPVATVAVEGGVRVGSAGRSTRPADPKTSRNPADPTRR